MSRGWGKVQEYLFGVVAQAKKPMTFEEIWTVAFPEGSFESDLARVLGRGKVGMARSLRRALRRLVDEGDLIAIGAEGRGDLFRYSLNPMMAALCWSKDQYETLAKRVAAEPGGEDAMNKAAKALFSKAD